MMKKKYLVSALLSVGLLLGACSNSTTETDSDTSGGETVSNQVTVEDIKKEGVLKVGVKDDVPGFGLLNTETNEIEGFEIDLAKKIAEEITGDPENVELTAVTAKTRGPLLDNGELDLIAATFTITDERKETYNFSESYYEDAVGILVKKDKNYGSIKDMDGATIGVAQSSSSEESMEEAAKENNITLKFSEFPQYADIKAALDSGRVDGFAVDRSILNGYVDENTEILPDRFAAQDYGIAVKKENTELSEYLNELLEKWSKDGTLDKMIADWGLND